jgi:hypothetical protein
VHTHTHTHTHTHAHTHAHTRDDADEDEHLHAAGIKHSTWTTTAAAAAPQHCSGRCLSHSTHSTTRACTCTYKVDTSPLPIIVDRHNDMTTACSTQHPHRLPTPQPRVNTHQAHRRADGRTVLQRASRGKLLCACCSRDHCKHTRAHNHTKRQRRTSTREPRVRRDMLPLPHPPLVRQQMAKPSLVGHQPQHHRQRACHWVTSKEVKRAIWPKLELWRCKLSHFRRIHQTHLAPFCQIANKYRCHPVCLVCWVVTHTACPC